MHDYYNDILRVEKERNRLLERIADKLDHIRDEMATTRAMLQSVPVNKLLIPMVDDGNSKNVNSAFVVKPVKTYKTIEEAADDLTKKENKE